MDYEALKVIRNSTTEQLADIALRFAAKYPQEFLSFVPSPTRSTFKYQVPMSAQIVDIRECDLWALSEKMPPHQPANGKVSAIKVARELWGLGLKEAKDLVEGLLDRKVLPSYPAPAAPPPTPLSVPISKDEEEARWA